jgi:hypothetical protein
MSRSHEVLIIGAGILRLPGPAGLGGPRETVP